MMQNCSIRWAVFRNDQYSAFVLYLISRIHETDEQDMLPSSLSLVERYNPETHGIAQYLIEHGTEEG